MPKEDVRKFWRKQLIFFLKTRKIAERGRLKILKKILKFSFWKTTFLMASPPFWTKFVVWIYVLDLALKRIWAVVIKSHSSSDPQCTSVVCLFCSVSDRKSSFSVRKSILTSKRHAKHPFTGQNTQQLGHIWLKCHCVGFKKWSHDKSNLYYDIGQKTQTYPKFNFTRSKFKK